jgi:hypothetical protein
MSADGDLAPGVDGGSTDADVPFFFRRSQSFTGQRIQSARSLSINRSTSST